MRSFLADGEWSDAFGPPVGARDCIEQPGIATLYAISGGLMELLGPVFWAALIVFLLQAELSAG